MLAGDSGVVELDPSSPYAIYDLNSDGRFTAIDTLQVINAVAAGDSIATSPWADLNHDDVIDDSDSQLVMDALSEYYASYLPSFTPSFASSPSDSVPSLYVSISDATLNIGDSVSLSGSFGHSDSSEYVTVSIDWGDSSETTSGFPSGYLSSNHSYSSPGTYSVSVVATDDDGDSVSQNMTIVVTQNSSEASDSAPTLSASLNNSTINVGDTVSLGGSFGHVESSETVTVSIDWGDSSETTSGFPSGYLSSSHSYSSAGTYSVSVVATDDDGDSVSENMTIVVTQNSTEVSDSAPTLSASLSNSTINRGKGVRPNTVRHATRSEAVLTLKLG